MKQRSTFEHGLRMSSQWLTSFDNNSCCTPTFGTETKERPSHA